MYVTKRRHRVGRSIKINKYQMSLAYFSLRAYCTLINREAIWINREKAGRGRVIRIRRREGEKPLGPRSQMTTRIWVPDLGFWDLGVRSWKVLSITHDLSQTAACITIYSRINARYVGARCSCSCQRCRRCSHRRAPLRRLEGRGCCSQVRVVFSGESVEEGKAEWAGVVRRRRGGGWQRV